MEITGHKGKGAGIQADQTGLGLHSSCAILPWENPSTSQNLNCFIFNIKIIMSTFRGLEIRNSKQPGVVGDTVTSGITYGDFLN